MKRTALNRLTPLRRGKAMRKVSAKRRKQQLARNACLEAVWERSQGMCEAKVRGVCVGVMHTGHEPLKRSRGGDPTDPAQVMAICDPCHKWLGRNEEAATMLGLLVPNNKSGDVMDTNSLNTALIQMPHDVTTDVLLEAGYQIARLKEIVKEVTVMWEAKMVERIQASGPIKDGDNLYRVGNPPKTSCNNVPAAVEALLVGVGGDFNLFCEHLSSGALKYGAFKATLGEDVFNQHFTVTRELELQADEATPRRLQKLNLAFSR